MLSEPMKWRIARDEVCRKPVYGDSLGDQRLAAASRRGSWLCPPSMARRTHRRCTQQHTPPSRWSPARAGPPPARGATGQLRSNLKPVPALDTHWPSGHERPAAAASHTSPDLHSSWSNGQQHLSRLLWANCRRCHPKAHTRTGRQLTAPAAWPNSHPITASNFPPGTLQQATPIAIPLQRRQTTRIPTDVPPTKHQSIAQNHPATATAETLPDISGRILAVPVLGDR